MTRYCTAIDREVLKLEYRVGELGYHKCKMLVVTAHDDVIPIYQLGLVLGSEINFTKDRGVTENEAYILVTKVLKTNPNFAQAESLRILHGAWADENLNLTDPFIWEDNAWTEYKLATLKTEGDTFKCNIDFRFHLADESLATKLTDIEWEIL